MSDTKPTMDEVLSIAFEGGYYSQNDPNDKMFGTVKFEEAKAALTAYIDDIVKDVIGEAPKPYINGKYPKRGESVTIDFENNYRESLAFIQENGRYTLWADQLTRYQTIKQERGL